MVDPPHERLKTQQTPKPRAQDPEPVPPRLEHSVAVKQVPLRFLLPLHSVLGNFTTLKIENCLSTLSSVVAPELTK